MSNFDRLQGVEPEDKIAARLSNLQTELEREVATNKEFASARRSMAEGSEKADRFIDLTAAELSEAFADRLQAILDRSKGETDG